MRLQRVGAKNDYSYGFYLYGWPAAQFLALWGVTRWGVVPYLAASVAAAGCFAVASWWFVEQRALRLKHRMLRPRTSSAFAVKSVPGHK